MPWRLSRLLHIITRSNTPARPSSAVCGKSCGNRRVLPLKLAHRINGTAVGFRLVSVPRISSYSKVGLRSAILC